MIGLKVVCWAYVMYLLLGRIANFDKCDTKSVVVRLIDNIAIIVLLAFIYFLYKG